MELSLSVCQFSYLSSGKNVNPTKLQKDYRYSDPQNAQKGQHLTQRRKAELGCAWQLAVLAAKCQGTHPNIAKVSSRDTQSKISEEAFSSLASFQRARGATRVGDERLSMVFPSTGPCMPRYQPAKQVSTDTLAQQLRRECCSVRS